MSTVVVYTQAYNAETTLRQSLDSVLNQSFQAFTYYVADNCSTDGTRNIIREYAAKDCRIRPIYYDLDDKAGSGVSRGIYSIKHIQSATDFEWLCILDADDTYDPRFLQEMLEFSCQNHLDLAVCSSRFIQSMTGRQIGTRSVPQEIVISGKLFGDCFPVYHQFMRAWWAKLICRTAIDQADFTQVEQNLSVGADTMFVFELLRHCGRVGLSPKLLHNYLVSPSSGSYRLDPNRIGADAVQHYATIEFLKEKVGRVSPQNIGFLYLVYFNAIVDTVSVLVNASNATAEEKLSGLRQLLSADVMLEMLGADTIEIDKRRGLIGRLLQYVNSLGEKLVYCEDGIWLGLTLSSLAGDQTEYIRFSKLQIRSLLANQCWDEAQQRLSEWESILPEDPDWARIKKNIRRANDRKLVLLGHMQYAVSAVERLFQSTLDVEIISICDLSGEHFGKNLQIDSKGICIPIIDFTQMVNGYQQDADVLITTDPFNWNTVLKQLRKVHVDNVYVVPNYVYWDTSCDFYSAMCKVPLERPMLTYYEYHTAEHCNLNCFHCGNFSNVLSEPLMGDLEQYEKDVSRLKELFWNVGKLRFQGGEPLLNPELPEFIRVTREAFPVADIGILSNGLLIPKATPSLFDAMRKYHVTFWISGYPPTYKMKDQILARCRAEGVQVSIMPLIEDWRMESIKVIGAPPSADWNEAEKWWRQCGAKDSHLLKDGYLYYCCFTSPLIPDLYKRLGLDVKDNHMWQNLDNLRFDLSDPELDGWTVSQKLDHVHECCLYCVNRWPNFKYVPWKTCPASQIKAEDYVWEPLHLKS